MSGVQPCCDAPSWLGCRARIWVSEQSQTSCIPARPCHLSQRLHQGCTAASRQPGAAVTCGSPSSHKVPDLQASSIPQSSAADPFGSEPSQARPSSQAHRGSLEPPPQGFDRPPQAPPQGHGTPGFPHQSFAQAPQGPPQPRTGSGLPGQPAFGSSSQQPAFGGGFSKPAPSGQAPGGSSFGDPFGGPPQPHQPQQQQQAQPFSNGGGQAGQSFGAPQGASGAGGNPFA